MTTEAGTSTRRRSMRVRAAAAEASIKLHEFDNKPVPQWLRDVAAGIDASPPHASVGTRSGDRRQVAAAAAGASIKLHEFDNKPVPQWLRDVAEGRPS